MLILVVAYLVDGYMYIPGKQYDYDYTARVVSALSNIQKQWSGLAIKSRLIVQPHVGHLLFKLEDVLVERLNEQVHSFKGRQGDFRPQLEYNSQLSKPFKALYEDGVVGTLYVDKNDAEWIVNFKKAIVAMFNVNLQHKNHMHVFKDQSVTLDPRAAYFRVLEVMF